MARSVVLGGAILLGTTLVARAAPSGGNAYFFGDSLTDCCHFGRTTNGPNWADLLAPQINEGYTATDRSNYAVGGALTSGFLLQVNSFTQSNTAVGPNDIAGIWIGTNDVWTSSYSASDTYAGQPVGGPIGRQPDAAALTNYIIGNIQLGLDQLRADGFQNVALLSPYDLGQAGVEPNAAAAALATQYSTALRDAESALYTPGLNTYFVDVESLMRQVQASPAAYGFAHSTAQDSCAANNCSTQPFSVQNTYVFEDNIHLTTGFDQLVAADAAAVINAGQATTVPEPASATLMLAGLVSVGFALGRRRKAGVPAVA